MMPHPDRDRNAIAAGVLFVVALIGVIGMIALLAHTVR
jgi:hypothetical protein